MNHSITVGTLRSLIAEMLLTEKAANRETWQNHINGFLIGAIGEFYKARFSEKNMIAVQQDIDQWDDEVSSLLAGALRIYEQKIKGFKNRFKAYKEGSEEVKEIDQKWRRIAERSIMKKYKLVVCGIVPQFHITDEDTIAFWKLADETLNFE